MNKPKRWLFAAGVAAAVLPLSMLGAAAASAQASHRSGQVGTVQVGRAGETQARTAVPSWGWPVGW